MTTVKFHAVPARGGCGGCRATTKVRSRARCSPIRRGPATARARLPRPDRLLGRRHHLPPARLLGPHRPGRCRPSARASGSGTQRLYSFKDILVLKVVKRLLDAGVSLQNIRVAVEALRQRGVDDLAQVTLLSDGTSVYECTSSEEVVDLLRGGQGVFGIAVSGALRELRGSLAHLPAERADGAEEITVEHPSDELARRRQQRSVAG